MAYLGVCSSFSLHSVASGAVLGFSKVWRGQTKMQHGGTPVESQELTVTLGGYLHPVGPQAHL